MEWILFCSKFFFFFSFFSRRTSSAGHLALVSSKSLTFFFDRVFLLRILTNTLKHSNVFLSHFLLYLTHNAALPGLSFFSDILNFCTNNGPTASIEMTPFCRCINRVTFRYERRHREILNCGKKRYLLIRNKGSVFFLSKTFAYRCNKSNNVSLQILYILKDWEIWWYLRMNFEEEMSN